MVEYFFSLVNKVAGRIARKLWQKVDYEHRTHIRERGRQLVFPDSRQCDNGPVHDLPRSQRQPRALCRILPATVRSHPQLATLAAFQVLDAPSHRRAGRARERTEPDRSLTPPAPAQFRSSSELSAGRPTACPYNPTVLLTEREAVHAQSSTGHRGSGGAGGNRCRRLAGMGTGQPEPVQIRTHRAD